MQPYVGPPWNDSQQIWKVEVFHHAPRIHGIQNAKMQKKKKKKKRIFFCDVILRYSVVFPTSSLWDFLILTVEGPSKRRVNRSLGKTKVLDKRKYQRRYSLTMQMLQCSWVTFSDMHTAGFQFLDLYLRNQILSGSIMTSSFVWNQTLFCILFIRYWFLESRSPSVLVPT